MPDDELKTSDRLYYAIAALRGWDEAADEARGCGGMYAVRFGRIVSSILVAADEDREPVAVSGALDEKGTGNVAIIYDRFAVLRKRQDERRRVVRGQVWFRPTPRHRGAQA